MQVFDIYKLKFGLAMCTGTSSPTSPLSRIHTCRRKRHQWQSPKRSLDSIKGAGAVLNFGLGISEYLRTILDAGCILSWVTHIPVAVDCILCPVSGVIPFARSLHAPLRQPQRQLPWRTVKCICHSLFFLWGWGIEALKSTYRNPNDFRQSVIPNSLPRSEIIITDKIKSFKVQQITVLQTFEQRLKESAKPATPSQPPAGCCGS